MTDRFADLTKIPSEPAMRLLAARASKIGTPLDAPASATVSVVLEELERKEAWVCMIRLLAAVLPEREAVWWACLAARDMVPAGKETPSMKAAEAWVFDPTDDNRLQVKAAMESADFDDDTSLLATAAFYAPGNLGPDEMAEFEAPPAAVSGCVFGMCMKTLGGADDPFNQMFWLIDRAIDIARGGNGQVPKPDFAFEPQPIPDDEEESA